MKTRERLFVFFTFLICCLALALLGASLGTQHWVTADAVRPSNDKSQGHVHFGLFRGTRQLNHGFGVRVYEMNVFSVQYREQEFMVRELYVATIVCVCAAILFGVISALLAIHNTASNPSEAICHYPGEKMIGLKAFMALQIE